MDTTTEAVKFDQETEVLADLVDEIFVDVFDYAMDLQRRQHSNSVGPKHWRGERSMYEEWTAIEDDISSRVRLVSQQLDRVLAAGDMMVSSVG